MTFAKVTAFTACLIAATGFGILIGPYVMGPDGEGASGIGIQAPAGAAVEGSTALTAPAARPVEAARAALPRLPLDSPDLHARLRPLLNDGADMGLAAEGFRNAAEFAAVAHAARNTGVPFMLLKHRVTEEGLSLADAILASNEQVNAVIEAERASAEAWSDIATIAG